ncbi:MAG: ribonuclease III [Gammaproteobacteria bacterium]|nr:ribonuclease III [Gammaproteobacteria bacterium]
MAASADRLVDRLNHSFQDVSLLRRALTHRSAGREHNERLEFLGDSILGYLVTEYLFEQFPDAREGQLTRARARLVRGETLATLARRLDLGAALLLGGGELKSGGRDRSSILADAFEAVIGALYLDAGIDPCRKFVLDMLKPELAALSLDSLGKDPKTELQEYLQARRHALPNYTVVSQTEAGHEHEFVIRCVIAERDLEAIGEGPSRRLAEQVAAKRLLEQLGDTDDR